LIENLHYIPALQVLDLSQNLIKSMKGISSATELTNLNISNNRVELIAQDDMCEVCYDIKSWLSL